MSAKDKLIEKLLRSAKKHKVLTYPVLALVAIISFFGNLFNWHNGAAKRIVAVIMVMVMFVSQSYFLTSSANSLVDTEEEYLGLKEKISEFLNEKIMHAIQRMDIEAIFTKESGRILKEKTAGTMLQMFVTDDLIASITAPIGEEIVKFIENNGRDYIQPEIDSGIETLEDMSLLELAEHCDIKQEQVKEIISKNYERIVNAGIEKAMEKLDIAGMIEEKINGMNVDELEQLVLAVMKKELDVIVNLGALIGALLGVINIFY